MIGDLLTLSDLVFYAVALLAVAGAAGVAFSRNIVYSAFSLLAALAGAAALFVFLSADLIAVVQVLVYIGGVLVLILFAIMLTNKIGNARGSNLNVGGLAGLGVFALLTVFMVYVAVATPWGQIRGPDLPVLRQSPLQPTSAAIGNALLTDFLLPFEIASLVLLAALIGAVIIARKEMRALTPSRELEVKR